jgi:hypothetical protein
MTGRIESVRGWLNNNKIWFETLTASLLSLMAVIVSVAQSCTASKQTELMSLQTQIAEAQALPQFEVALNPKFNDATRKYDDYILVVSNHGGPIFDFSAEAAYFIQVTIPGANFGVMKADIPVDGYFTASFVSAANTGELVTMVGNHNNARAVEIQQDIRQAADARQWGFANMDEQVVTRFSYRDMLNRQHEDYYEAHFAGGGSRMPSEIGKARFAKWEAAPRVKFSSVRADDFFKRTTSVESNRP